MKNRIHSIIGRLVIGVLILVIIFAFTNVDLTPTFFKQVIIKVKEQLEESVSHKLTQTKKHKNQSSMIMDTDYVYENTTSGVLTAQADCTTSITKVINVPDVFIVSDLKVGLNLSHTYRGDLQITLTSPKGTSLVLVDVSADSLDNFDVLLADTVLAPINDGNDDDITAPNYEGDRSANPNNPLGVFDGEFATGDWTLTICNVNQGSSGGRPLTFNSAKLLIQLPESCILREANAMAICNNNGTIGDYSDDYYEITVNPKGAALGAAYNVSGDYGGTTFLETNIPYDSIHTLSLQVPLGQHTTVIITDTDSSGCQIAQRVFSPAECSTPIVCYAISDQGNPDKLFKYNSGTGVWTELPSTGRNGIESLAYDPFSDLIYTVSYDSLGLVDTLLGGFTPIGTKIGTMNGPNGMYDVTDVDGLTFDPFSKKLWASARRGGGILNDYIFQIDPVTGNFIPNAFGVNVDYIIAEAVYDPVNGQFVYDVDDMAMDPLTHDLYGVANNGGVGGVLVIYDKADGTIKKEVGNFQGIDDIESLGFFNDGFLYGSTGDNSPDALDKNRFFVINKEDASLEELAKIDPTDTQVDFESCDCLTGGLNYITGTIFQDNDQDGSLTGGDIGFMGVTVNLFRDIDGDSLYTPGTDFLLDTANTDINGFYSFIIAATGDFLVNIDQIDLPSSSSMTTDNIENAQFISTGLTNPNNDFGFTFYCELSIEKIFYSDCMPTEPNYAANLNIVIDWLNPPSGQNIILSLEGSNQMINVIGGATSPDTVIFNIPADGSSNHILTAAFSTTTTCGDSATIGYRLSCPVDVTPCDGSTGIGGNAFTDFNYNGTKDDNAGGVQGIQVVLYECIGDQSIPVDTVFTDGDGDYVFPNGVTNGEKYRVEFILPSELAHLEPTQAGNDNGTTVQFVTAPACADLGVARPTDYCDNNPRLVTPCFENGTGIGNTNKGLVSFSYEAMGLPTSQGGTQEDPRGDAQIQEIGATWGTAWQPNKKRLFVSSFLKRFVAFENSPGYVYTIDYSGASLTLSTGFNLQGIVPANGGAPIDLGEVCRTLACSAEPGKTGFPADYILPDDPTATSIDLDAFGKVGTISYGDIDLSEDGKTLWLVNLHQKALISVAVNGMTLPGTVRQYLIEDLQGVPNCSNGELRPFALEFYGGRGYVGVVCDGSLSQDSTDVKAYVLSFDPNNVGLGFQREIKINMDYPREYGQSGNPIATGHWRPWGRYWEELNPQTGGSDDNMTAPQPILSDIEIAENGSMVIAFTDRFGHQNGRKNYRAISQDDQLYDTNSAGDVLHVCKVDGNWVMEGEAGCVDADNNDETGNPYNTLSQSDGPNGVGEYYYTDFFGIPSSSDYYHGEVLTGALALKAGTFEVATTTYDPLLEPAPYIVNSQGIRWFNTNNGAMTDAYQVVPPSATNPQTFAKSNGLGDLELMCSAAPLEIGNYVWLDTNEDGIQDPCEPPLVNVTMTLFNSAGDSLASVLTDSNGHYYFNDTEIKNSNYTSDTILQANTEYFIVAGNHQFDFLTQTLFDSLTITLDSVGMDDQPRLNDSDGSIGGTSDPSFVQGYPFVKVTTGDAGEVDHSLDFGFKVTYFDYGDLPDSGDGEASGNYETSFANGGPRHQIIDGLFLGDTIDAELDGIPNTLANGDNGDHLDDEDGVTITTNLNIQPGGTIRLPIKTTNRTDSVAYLEAWIDWNNDGVLSIGERVANLDDSGSGFPPFITINVPANVAVDVNIGVRFRLSLEDEMTPYGIANSGEVEDYLLQTNCPTEICLPIMFNLKKE